MPFWKRSRGSSPSIAIDEFLDGGEERSASPFDLKRGAADWQNTLAKLGKVAATPADLALPAFSLIRGGDLFERPKHQKPPRTDPELISTFADTRLRPRKSRAGRDVRDAAVNGVLRVLAGNPALCRRMLLARPIELVIVPKDDDFRNHGFPPHTNPRAAGIFWNQTRDDHALLGLREEHVLPRPWLMAHEMTHAVHFLGFTPKERDEIDRMLMPVYRNRRWVDEAMAIYAERAFGADYSEAELAARDLYGKTRRDWNPQHVFSKFVEELFRPKA